jgi:cytoskeletal protein RodZ
MSQPANASPVAGPSFLGLNEAEAKPKDFFEPTVDHVREKSFSGMESFYEPERSKGKIGRVILLVVLLAALAGAGWWTYNNSMAATERRQATTFPSTTDNAPSAAEPRADVPPTQPPSSPAEKSAETSAALATPTDVTPAPTETPKSVPNAGQPKVAETVRPAHPTPAKPAAVAKQQRPAKSARTLAAKAAPASVAANAADDNGDALFHKGEGYLYGRGGPENCDEAVKNLKAASAKRNAKARSTFGTMYATGHCVPRDLPTSYSWFALALRADPNNQILEKDLTAIWNRMTPPERQMATKINP